MIGGVRRVARERGRQGGSQPDWNEEGVDAGRHRAGSKTLATTETSMIYLSHWRGWHENLHFTGGNVLESTAPSPRHWCMES